MNQEKFENLILLICAAVPEKLTTIRLNKLLWLADKAAFLRTGKKITDCVYLRKQYGPVPRHNGDALAVMREKGLLGVTEHRDEETGLPRREYHALSPAHKEKFSAQELGIIESVLGEHAATPTRHLIGLSHDLVWANREDGEVINFEAYLSEFNFPPEYRDKIKARIDAAELAYEE